MASLETEEGAGSSSLFHSHSITSLWGGKGGYRTTLSLPLALSWIVCHVRVGSTELGGSTLGLP